MYPIQVALLFTSFFLIYRYALRSTGLLSANRFFLLLGYPLAFILPLLPWHKFMEIAPFINESVMTYFLDVPNRTVEVSTSLLSTGQENIELSTPANWSFSTFLKLFYFIGAASFIFRYALRLNNLAQMRKHAHRIINYDAHLPQRVKLYGLKEPNNLAATFGNCFYISLNLLGQSEDRKFILAHENAHFRQGHSLDIVLAEIGSAMLWCHPFVWSYRSALRLNLEFLADREVLANGYSPKAYQYSLLRFCESPPSPQPILPFTHPPLKERIMMMKMQKRSRFNYISRLTLLSFSIIAFLTACQPTESITTTPHQIESNQSVYQKTFTGSNAWKQVIDILQQNYTNYTHSYLINGHPAQNNIIPKPEDIQLIELSANTISNGEIILSFKTRQNNWTSVNGWHFFEAQRSANTNTYINRTLDLLNISYNNYSSITFFGVEGIQTSVMKHIEEKHPNASITYFIDNQSVQIQDILNYPYSNIEAIVVLHSFVEDITNYDRVICNVITKQE